MQNFFLGSLIEQIFLEEEKFKNFSCLYFHFFSIASANWKSEEIKYSWIHVFATWTKFWKKNLTSTLMQSIELHVKLGENIWVYANETWEAKKYENVSQTRDSWKSSYSNGFPIVKMFKVYEKFQRTFWWNTKLHKIIRILTKIF